MCENEQTNITSLTTSFSNVFQLNQIFLKALNKIIM